MKHICIIGGGPSGLGALKVVLESPQYKAGQWKPSLFEAREAAGGIWYVPVEYQLPIVLM